MKIINFDMLRKMAAVSRPQIEPTPERLENARKIVRGLLAAAGYIENRNGRAIDYMARYRIGREDARKDPADRCDMPKKGLWIPGHLGTGKTTVLWVMSAAWRIPYCDAPGIMLKFAAEGAEAVIQDTCGIEACYQDIIIDDLGAEGEARRYGATLDIPMLILERYKIWRLHGSRTHFATNLDKTQIVTRYGERIHDRLQEMCEVVPMEGNSHRKGGGARTKPTGE